MVLSNDLKKAIAFGLIIGAIISICNMCFASDAETVDIYTVSGVNIPTNGGSGVFVSGSGSTGYFAVEPGYTYSIVNNDTSAKRVAFSDSVADVGIEFYNYTDLSAGATYSFNSNDFGYVYFNYYGYTTRVNVTREALPGLTNFVDNISYSLSVGNLSSVWALAVPIIAISVLFGLGFYLLKRLLNRIKRAKGGV